MAGSAAPNSALVHRANLNIAAAVVAKFGSGAPDSLIGRAIDEVRASHSVAELAGGGGMAMVVGAVDTFLARQFEADRPRNLYGAEAARAAQAGEGSLRSGMGVIDAIRAGSSARYRELAGDASKSDGAGSGSPSVTGSGGEPAGAAFWGTAKGMLLTRAYANDNHMGWAPPDLMQMGRPALQALKESGLKGDGYKALRDPSGLRLDNRTIVAGAQGYMRRNGVDHNEAARSSAAVDRLPMPTDLRERHRAAVEGIHTATPENEKERQEALRKSGDEIVQHDPARKAAVDRERKGYKVDKDAAPKAEAKAGKDEAEAKKDDSEARKKGAAVQNTGRQASASKSRLDAALGP